MIVLDVSTVIGAVIRRGSVPDLATRHALASDDVAVSAALLTELNEVLTRPRLARFIDPQLRDDVLALFDAQASFFEPGETVAECRDPNDDKVLELALAAGAAAIITSDADLLVLHPWRGIRILRPADYLALVADAG